MKIFKLNVLQIVAVAALLGGVVACESEQKVQRPRIEVTMAPLGVGEGSVPWPGAMHPSMYGAAYFPAFDKWYRADVAENETVTYVEVDFVASTERSWPGTYAELLAADALFACTSDVEKIAATETEPAKLVKAPMYDEANRLSPYLIADTDPFLWWTNSRSLVASCYGAGFAAVEIVDPSEGGPQGNLFGFQAALDWRKTRANRACNFDPNTKLPATYSVPGLEEQDGPLALYPELVGRPAVEVYDKSDATPGNWHWEVEDNGNTKTVVGAAGEDAFNKAQSALSYAGRSLCMAKRLAQHMQSQQVAAMDPNTAVQLQSFVQERALTAVAQYTFIVKSMLQFEDDAAGDLTINDVEQYPLVLGRYYSELKKTIDGLKKAKAIGYHFSEAVALLISASEASADLILRDGYAANGEGVISTDAGRQLAALMYGADVRVPALTTVGFEGESAQAFLSLARGADALRITVDDMTVRTESSAAAAYDAVEVNLRDSECKSDPGSRFCDSSFIPTLEREDYLLASRFKVTMDDARAVIKTLTEVVYGAGVEVTDGGDLDYSRYRIDPRTYNYPNTLEVPVLLSSILSGNHEIEFLNGEPGSPYYEYELHIDPRFRYLSASGAAALVVSEPLQTVAGAGAWPSEYWPGGYGSLGFRGLWAADGTTRLSGVIPVLASVRALKQSFAESDTATNFPLEAGLSSVSPMLKAALGDETVELKFLYGELEARPVCAHVFGVSPESTDRYAIERIDDPIGSTSPPLFVDPAVDPVATVPPSIIPLITGEVVTPSTFHESYVEACVDDIGVANPGWGMALVRYDSDGRGERLIVTTNALTEAASQVSSPTNGSALRAPRAFFAAAGGALQERFLQAFTASKHNWSKPAYDPLDLPTDWNPTASAELFGGSESEEAYQYFLRAAKEAGKEATAATEKAFANLRQQEVDELALEQAEEKGAGLRKLEMLAACGDLPCGAGAGDTKSYNFRALDEVGNSPGCSYVNPKGVEVDVCQLMRLQLNAGLTSFGSPQFGVELPAVVVDTLNGSLSSSTERSLASYMGTTMGATLREVLSAVDALRVSLERTQDASIKGASDMRAAVAQVGSAQLNADATCLDAELGFASGMLEHDRFIAGLEDAREEESFALIAKSYACEFVATNQWATQCTVDPCEEKLNTARVAAELLCSTCDNGNPDAIAVFCGDADHGMKMGRDDRHFFWTMDHCITREAESLGTAKGWSASEAFHAAEACALASSRLNDDNELGSRARLDALADAYLDRLEVNWDGLSGEGSGEISVEDKLRSQWIGRCRAASSQGTVAVEQEIASYQAVVGSGVTVVQEARAASDRLLKALEAWRFTLRQVGLTQAKLSFEQSLEEAQYEQQFSLRRKYSSFDLWRARALSENARRLAVAARRSIEGRFVVDLSDLHAPEPFVESPAIWADEIYASDLKPPAALGRTSGATQVSGAVYSSAIEDYVSNLDLFVKGYAVARPTSIAKRDTEVIQLPAPAGVATAVTSGGGYSYVDPDSAQWSFYCPKQDAWISNPHLTEFGLTDASLATACGDSPPSRARLGFWLDPWGRYNGDFNSSPPYELRHNARWQQLAVNLVGTGVRDCSKAQDPLVCYAEPFIRYNLRHVGPAVVSDYQGTFKTLTIPSAVIEGGKALASEQWVDPVTQGFQSTSVANVARYEYAGRPLGGTYELMLELTDDVRLERIQRIQLVAQTDYWVRQLGSDSPVDPTLLVSQCGNGILEADETCEMVINGVAPTAESDAGVGAPICPASCDDNDPATLDVTGGVAALCTSTCEHQLIGRCLSGDGFCPPSCTASEDSDCNTGTLVSWVSSGDYVTDTNVTAEPRFGWVPGANLLEGNRDLLSGEIAPFGTSNAPVMSYDAGAGRETFVQIEGARTNLAPSSDHSNVTPRVVGEGGTYFWTNAGEFKVRANTAPGLDGAFEADEIAFVPTTQGVRFRTEGTTVAGAHTVSVFHRGTGVPAVWRLQIFRDSAGTLDADQAPLYPSATDTWERAVHTRSDFSEGDLVMPYFGVWQSTEMSELYPTGPVLFDMWQVEAGTFPSSPITTRGATRPENHLVVPAENVPEAVRSGLWSFRFVPYFASNDALDGGAGAKAHVLSFNDGSNGLTVSAEPNALVQGELDQFGNFLPPTTTGQVAITSMDGDTNYHSTNLTWDRYDTLEVSFDFTQNRVLVHNLTAEAAGDVQAAPATDFSGSPAILRTFDMWVGKQAANEATEFFGLVSQPKATQFSNGVAAVCGDGLLEGGETCDDGDGDALSLCKSSCKSDNLACTSDVLLGSAAECDAYCAYQPIVQCQNGDGCCPTGCTAFADDDCGGPATYFSVVEHFDAAKGVTASDDQVDGWVGAIASVQLTAALTTERPTWVTGANGNPGLRFEGADADELSGTGLSIFESGGDEGYQLLVVGVEAVGGSSEPLSTVSASGGDFELKSVYQGEAVRGAARGDSAEVSALLGSGPHILETWVESGTVHTRVDGGATSTASWNGTFSEASDLLTLGGAAAGEFTLYEAVYANRAPNFNAATAYRASLQAKYGLDKDPNTLFGDRLMSWHRADRGVELKPESFVVHRWEDQGGRGADLISTGYNTNNNNSSLTEGAPKWVRTGDADNPYSYPYLEFNHDEFDVMTTEAKVDWTGLTTPIVYMVMRLRSDGYDDGDVEPDARYFLYRMGRLSGVQVEPQPAWTVWFGGEHGAWHGVGTLGIWEQKAGDWGQYLGVTQLQSEPEQPRFDLMVQGLQGGAWSASFDDGAGLPDSVEELHHGAWGRTIDFASPTPVGEIYLGAYRVTGEYMPGFGSGQDVDFAEVMLIEGPLSPSEEAELRTYLSNRYGKSW